MPSDRDPLVFAMGPSTRLGERICSILAVKPGAIEERAFEDGEQKTRPLVDVRDRDVYVALSLAGGGGQSVHDKLCRLLFFIGAVKDAGAARVTAVTPYLCYGRKDRRTKARDPVTFRYVAQLFEAVGTDRIISLEVHNVAAFQNAFRCATEHLNADAVFARYFAQLIGEAPVAVVSPDPGGVKRADRFRRRLEEALQRPAAAGFMEKYRSRGEVTGENFGGDVAGRAVIIIDDLISTGGTMSRTAAACREHGASKVYVAAAHGLFGKGASDVVNRAPIDRIIVTDTVEPLPAEVAGLKDRIEVLDVAAIFAEAIRRCHEGGPMSELVGEED